MQNPKESIGGITPVQSESEFMQMGALIGAICQVATTDELYKSVVSVLPQVFGNDKSSISLYSEERQQLEIISSGEIEICSDQAKNSIFIETGMSYDEYHASVSLPVILRPDEIQSAAGGNTFIDVLSATDMASVLIAPVFVDDKILGTINVLSRSALYTARELDKLGQISNIVGIALKRTQLAEIQGAATHRHRLYADHLELLNLLGEKLSLVSTMDDALAYISECAKNLVNALRVSYSVLEPCGEKLRVTVLVGRSSDIAGQVVPLDQSGLADTFLNNKQYYATDLLNSASALQRSLGESGINHVWSFPIVCDGMVKGALNVGASEINLDPGDATSVLATLSRFLGSTLQRVDAQFETLKIMSEIERQAKTDMLSGLPNRTEFHRRLRTVLNSAVAKNTCTGVFFLDLDLFKNINDTLGHDVGDELLCHISRRLECLLEPGDTVARIGGDEFLLLRAHIDTRENLDEFGRRVVNAIKKPLVIVERTLEVGVSVGAACYPEDGNSAEELIKNADIAMYRAKALGRNQCQVFSGALAASISRRVRIETYLRDAIENHELSLVFQPQFDFYTGRAIAVEALLRWEHPVEGCIPPDEFIGIAEQCGMIDKITDWVIENSLKVATEFRKLEPDLKVAVNVSASEFSSHGDLFSRVTGALAKSGLPAEALEIEMTETALLSNPEHAKSLINQFSAVGVSLAIDDFGTGYASLSYLIQLPINTIKIDKSFVDDLDSDVKKQSVVGGIIAIASGMNLYTVGEGVETIEQFNWLNNHGCRSAQGYFLSKPVRADEIPCVLKLLTKYSVAA